MAQRSLTALAVAVCASLLATTSARAAPAGSFPCRWNYTLYVGLHAGYETGGESADCTGRPGTLTLSARLYRLTPGSHTWRLADSTSRSWTNPTLNHYIELSKHCSLGKVRAVFNWTLDDRSGHLLAHNTVTTAPVDDPGPKCAYILR
jgi:hypothetical protein